MNWQSVADFFVMGGYAFYVWGAYAGTFVALAFELAALWRRRRRRA